MPTVLAAPLTSWWAPLPEHRDPLLLLPVPAATSAGPGLEQLRMGMGSVCGADLCSDGWCQPGEPCLGTETAPEPDTARGDTDTALLFLHHTHLPSSPTPAGKGCSGPLCSLPDQI